jgi:Tol biopolymer transport system component
MKPLIFLAGLFFSLQSFAQAVKVTLFRDSALDVMWSPADSNMICYSVKGKDSYYDLHIATPDRKKDVCITCDHPALPNRHIANPSWHPSGKWLLSVVEKKEHPRSSTNALPGFGAYCDIWLIAADGTKAYKLVEIPNDFDHGVIAPRFSPDGKQIVWTDRFRRPGILNAERHFGFWTVKLADFTWGTDSIPSVSTPKDLFPGYHSFIECYGFSPDGKKIIFCGSFATKSAWTSQLFTMNIDGTGLQQITQGEQGTGDYNEHGSYSPDGKKIIWMSNKDNKNKGTDWWIMNSDGTNKKRLTFFNIPGDPMYVGKARWTGYASWSPERKTFHWRNPEKPHHAGRIYCDS